MTVQAVVGEEGPDGMITARGMHSTLKTSKSEVQRRTGMGAIPLGVPSSQLLGFSGHADTWLRCLFSQGLSAFFLSSVSLQVLLLGSVSPSQVS